LQSPSQITIDKARRLIGECVLFRKLNPEQRRMLENSARLREFSAGEAIFLMGDPGDSMMAVLTGQVRISVPSSDGKEIVLGMMQPGDFFGELALLDGMERSAEARAVTVTTLAILSRRDVLHFLERNPGAWLGMVEVLCERLRRTTVQITEVALLELPVRLAKTLLRLVGIEEETAPKPGLHQVKLSQRELGNIVGATRESVNKCMREWQRDGTIKVDGNIITILYPASLRAVADANKD
jgi:CRP/FNR family transcriptional regulator, cyclic AMP receptor protein